MTASRLLLVLGLVVGGCAVAWLILDEAREPPPFEVPRHRADEVWGRLVGTVVDAAGSAVPGARVFAHDGHGFGGEGRSDAEGRYEVALGLLRHASYDWVRRPWSDARLPYAVAGLHVRAEAEGFVGSAGADVEARRAERVPCPPITLLRGGSVIVDVRSAAGLAVAASVRATPVEDGAGPGTALLPSAAVMARHAGAPLRLGPQRPRRWSVTASAGPRVHAGGVVEIREGAQGRLVLTLATLRAAITGRVVGPDGSPVVGARVTLAREPAPAEATAGTRPERAGEAVRVPGDGPRTTRGTRERRRRLIEQRDRNPASRLRSLGVLHTVTGLGGSFLFGALETNRTYRLHLPEAWGHPGSARTGVAVDTHVDLAMPARFRLTLRAVDAETGREVRGCRMAVLRRALAQAMSFHYELDPARVGAQEAAPVVEALAPGPYEVRVRHPRYELARKDVDITTAAVTVEVALRPAARLRGVVRTEAGRPLAGLPVALRAPRSREEPGPGRIVWTGALRARTDAEGRFEFRAVPSGVPLRLEARGKDVCADVEIAEARDAAEVLLVTARPYATLRVTVHARQGYGLAAHPVQLASRDTGDAAFTGSTGPTGAVLIEGLPPGLYRVRAVDPREDPRRDEVRTRIRDVELAAGEAREVRFEAPDAVRVTGTVRVDGRIPAVAQVGFGPRKGTADYFVPLLADTREGRYVLSMPPGRYAVSVRVPRERHLVEGVVVIPNQPRHAYDVEVGTR